MPRGPPRARRRRLLLAGKSLFGDFAAKPDRVLQLVAGSVGVLGLVGVVLEVEWASFDFVDEGIHAVDVDGAVALMYTDKLFKVASNIQYFKSFWEDSVFFCGI